MRHLVATDNKTYILKKKKKKSLERQGTLTVFQSTAQRYKMVLLLKFKKVY